MNTKGMKFLAVLAVLAMAFAAFAVVAPAETDDAAGAKTVIASATAITENDSTIDVTAAAGDIGKYIVSDAVSTVNVKADGTNALTLYVKEGMTVTVNITSDTESGKIYLKSCKDASTDSDATNNYDMVTIITTADKATSFCYTAMVTQTAEVTGSVAKLSASGQVEVTSIGGEASGTVVVSGIFQIKGTGTLANLAYDASALYKASFSLSSQTYGATTKSIFYGADVPSADRTLTIKKDENVQFAIVKGDFDLTVNYTNYVTTGNPKGDYVVVLSLEDIEETSLTNAIKVDATYNTGMNNAPRLYGGDASKGTLTIKAATTGNNGLASVYSSAGAAEFKIASLNAWGTVSNAGTPITTTTVDMKSSGANKSVNLAAIPTVLRESGADTAEVDANGDVQGGIFAYGEVSGDFNMKTGGVLNLGPWSKVTSTITVKADSNVTSKISLTDFYTANKLKIGFKADTPSAGINGIEIKNATNDEAITLNGELDIVSGTTVISTTTTGTYTADITINNSSEILSEGVLYVKSGARLVLPVTTATSANSEFLVKGTMKVAGEISSANDSVIQVLKSGTTFTGKFKAKAGAIFTNIIVQGGSDADHSGNIDLDEAMSVESVSGDTVYSRTYSQLQTVEVVDSYSVKNGAVLTIRGTFKVPAGAYVSIDNGGKIVVEGDTSKVDIAGSLYVSSGTNFIINGAVTTTVSGLLSSEGKVYISSATTKIADGGKFISEGDLFVGPNGMAVASGGTFDIRGAFFIQTITNSGTIVFNEAVMTQYNALANNTFTPNTTNAAVHSNIIQYEKGATVKVVELAWDTDCTTVAESYLLITDEGLKHASDSPQLKQNYVKIYATSNAFNGVSGITVTENISTVTTPEKKTNGQMIVSGNVDYASSSTASEGAAATIVLGANSISTASVAKSDIVIKDTLRIGEFVKLDIINADVTVSGSLIVVKNAIFDNTLTGSVTVTGSAQIIGVTSVPAALGGILNGAAYKVIGDENNYVIITNFTDAVNNNTLATELTNIFIYGKVSTTADLIIPEELKIKAGSATPSITIGSGSVINTIVLLENGSEIASGIAIVVKATLTAENYKNLKTGDITADVKVVNGDSVTYTNITTAIGYASAGDVITASGDVVISNDVTIPAGVTVVIGDDATMTINKNVTLTVAGILASEKDIAAGTGAVFGDNTKIVVPGVMMVAKPKTLDAYKISGAYYSDDDYNYVSPVEMAVLVADDITIKGKVTTTLLDVEGTSTAKKKITVASDASFEAGIIALEYATIAVTAGTFTGTIMDQYATVIFENVNGLTAASSDAYYLSGTATVTDDEGSVAVALGTVTVNNALNLAADDLEFEIASGAQVKAAKSTGILTLGDGVVIEGTITTTNGGSVVDAGKIYILGSLVVMPADVSAGTTAGTASLKYVFVGIDPESLQKSTSAGAAISGASIGSPDYVAVAAGSTVDEQIVADKKFTVFTVDGAAYMTVYAIENAPAIKSFALPIIANAVATEWGNPLTEKAVTTEKVGSLAVVYAMINYSIYKIEVYTDAGIKAVSIDGVEMLNEKNNMFITISNFKAGTHTIAFTLKDGYQEDDNGVHLYTVDGTVLKDLKFTVSGDAGTTKLLLNGTEVYVPEPTPEEQQSEWTITTILLVILVILIAIMAVIVALRLNRS